MLGVHAYNFFTAATAFEGMIQRGQMTRSQKNEWERSFVTPIGGHNQNKCRGK